MARANPNSFCTKWVEISDSHDDAWHTEEDRKFAEAKAAAKAETEAERKARQRAMDCASMYRSNAPFSIFASTANDPQ